MSTCARCTAALKESDRFCAACGAPATQPMDETGAIDVIRFRLQEAVRDEFMLQVELGRGSMGVAYLAKQLKLDRLVVIKALLQNRASGHDLVARFRHEAKTQSRLLHPHIVPILDVREVDDLIFLVMPYIDGPNLRRTLETEPRPPIDFVERVMREMGDALAFAHRTGVIHRDVKPENILMDRATGGFFLADFGIAKMMAPDETVLTMNFSQVGTPRYMAPEQWENVIRIDGRSDQYGLGLIGWEMLAGRCPFDGRSTIEIYNQQKSFEPEDIAAIRPDAPAALVATVMRAIRKVRDDRFGTMEDFVSSLAGRQVADPLSGPEASTATATVTSAASTHPVPTSTSIPVPPETPAWKSSVGEPTLIPAEPIHAPGSKRASFASWILPVLGIVIAGAALAVWLSSQQKEEEPLVTNEAEVTTAPAETPANPAAPKRERPAARTTTSTGTSSGVPSGGNPSAGTQSSPGSGTTTQTQKPSEPSRPTTSGPPNAKPFATFSYAPKRGGVGTTFRLDASGSHDDRDTPDRLEVRWDLDNDGNWDTGWSAAKATTVRYTMTGKRHSRVQVRDSSGNTAIFIDGPTVTGR